VMRSDAQQPLRCGARRRCPASMRRRSPLMKRHAARVKRGADAAPPRYTRGEDAHTALCATTIDSHDVLVAPLFDRHILTRRERRGGMCMIHRAAAPHTACACRDARHDTMLRQRCPPKMSMPSPKRAFYRATPVVHDTARVFNAPRTRHRLFRLRWRFTRWCPRCRWRRGEHCSPRHQITPPRPALSMISSQHAVALRLRCAQQEMRVNDTPDYEEASARAA